MKKLFLLAMLLLLITFNSFTTTDLMSVDLETENIEKKEKVEVKEKSWLDDYHLMFPMPNAGVSAGTQFVRKDVSLAIVYKNLEYSGIPHLTDWYGMGILNLKPNKIKTENELKVVYIHYNHGEHLGFVGKYFKFKCGITNERELYLGSEVVVGAVFLFLNSGVDLLKTSIEGNGNETYINFYIGFSLGF